jgi:hypothetical protein
MFDRLTCAKLRVAADSHTDLAALTALAALLQHVLNDHLVSSNARKRCTNTLGFTPRVRRAGLLLPRSRA